MTTCTLCGHGATLSATPNFGRYKAISCANCGEFVVSEAARDRILGLTFEIKETWRRAIASATDDAILLILVEPVGAGGGLKADLVPRTSLRL